MLQCVIREHGANAVLWKWESVDPEIETDFRSLGNIDIDKAGNVGPSGTEIQLVRLIGSLVNIISL